MLDKQERIHQFVYQKIMTCSNFLSCIYIETSKPYFKEDSGSEDHRSLKRPSERRVPRKIQECGSTILKTNHFYYDSLRILQHNIVNCQ